MADSPGIATIRIELDVQFDSAEALTTAALARAQDYDYGSEEEAQSERELISSDPGAALTQLLDIDAIVSETTPLEITSWTCGAESVTLHGKDAASEHSTELPPTRDVGALPESTGASA